MEIKQLKSFVTVAECKSFSRAAQLLYISQPSISTHISMLEQETSVRLIERTSKSVSLTEEGRKFYDYAVSILKINDKMLNEIGSHSLPCIHIGASTVPSAYILPDVLSGYFRENSGYTFQVVQSDSRKVIDGVLEGVYDVGFIGSTCHEKGIDSHVIAGDKMIFIAPNNKYYKNLIENSDNPAEKILEEPFILREEGSGSGEMLKSMLSGLGLMEKNLNVCLRTNDHESIINMVEQGIGVSLVSSLSLNNKNGRNVLCLSPDKVCTRDFYMIHKHSALNKEAVKKFINYLTNRSEE